jgi:tetratricopeptide (TPR) repeat protein
MASLAEEWAEKATDAAPHFYEAWHWRAHIAHLNKKWSKCLEFASKRLSLERQGHHLVKPEVWEWWGYDLLALSSHNLGLHTEAIKYGEKALAHNSSNSRLNSNLQFYRSPLEKIDNVEVAISLITPTRNREDYLIDQYHRLAESSYKNWQWLIYDDSEKEFTKFNEIIDGRVLIVKGNPLEPVTIGEKRNHLVAISESEFIVHIDDDDEYGPTYLETMVNQILNLGSDLHYLNTWIAKDNDKRFWKYSSDVVLPKIEAWGFSYIYKKELALEIPFEHHNWEDHIWFLEIQKKQKKVSHFHDPTGDLVVKNLHNANTSSFPFPKAQILLKENWPVRDKLLGFPRIWIVSCNDAFDRREKLKKELTNCGLDRFEWVVSERSAKKDEKSIQRSIFSSHQAALRQFLLDPSSEWAIIFEDDVSLEFVRHWKFTWPEVFKKMVLSGYGIHQLCLISTLLVRPDLHLRDDEKDFSAGAYLISKESASLIVELPFREDLNCESNLFGSLPVLSRAIFSCHIGDKESAHSHHDVYHRKSFDDALAFLMKSESNF